jgi:hypothetical protein
VAATAKRRSAAASGCGATTNVRGGKTSETAKRGTRVGPLTGDADRRLTRRTDNDEKDDGTKRLARRAADRLTSFALFLDDAFGVVIDVLNGGRLGRKT